jgi:hypothetical protein
MASPPELSEGLECEHVIPAPTTRGLLWVSSSSGRSISVLSLNLDWLELDFCVLWSKLYWITAHLHGEVCLSWRKDVELILHIHLVSQSNQLKDKIVFKMCLYWPGAVTHAYNFSYLGSRDQEDCCLRPAWAKSWQDPISINKRGGVAHACGPSYWEA